ncbi:MAG: triphosphoribosyl-dephospho-CoA synthase [Pirellulaceae bacterium]
MANALTQILGQSDSVADAVLTACRLEATASKAGNVHPNASFADLCYDDFLAAAQIASECFADVSASVARRTLSAVTRTSKTIRTNVNLGILLLLTPLIKASECETFSSLDAWQPAVARALRELTPDDSSDLMRAIQVAGAGGLGSVDEMDVHQFKAEQTVDIVAAMRLAKTHDRIARQYANGFEDFFTNVVPIVHSTLANHMDPHAAIADAHLLLLAADVDTLIQRKNGIEVAKEVQRRAQQIDLSDSNSRDDFDAFLRSQSNRLNPGTTADLIAAALFVLLRTGISR